MTALVRVEGWPEALALYLHARLTLPFAWGTNDCVLFAAGAVKAVTEQDLLPDYRWANEIEAAARLKEEGGLRAVVNARLPRLKNKYFAQRGDIALLSVAAARDARVHPLAVCDGPHFLSPGPTGVMRNTFDSVVVVWGVGHA